MTGTPETNGQPAQPSANDFISTYADYADVLEAPREVHEVVAISLLAAVLNPRVSIQYGALPLTLDLWTLILSGSGLGRNTLLSLAYPVLSASGLAALVRSCAWGSGPAFYEDTARNPTGLLVWPEISHELEKLNNPQFGGVKEWLTDRFDNDRTPDDIRYRTGRSTATPPIVFLDAPRLNILATSSIDWFVPNLAREDTTGGFIPRWLIVRVPEVHRIVPKPKVPDRRLIPQLAAHLKKAVALKGQADLSRVEDLYEDWYIQADGRFRLQPNQALARPFFNRLRALVLKLAVIYEVSESCSLSVTPQAMNRALAHAALTEATIFGLIPTGLTPEGFLLEKMERKVQSAGAPGISQSEFTRAVQDMRFKDRMDRLSTLAHAGRVRQYQRPSTGGRPPIFLVHCDFWTQHEKDYPCDTPPSKP